MQDEQSRKRDDELIARTQAGDAAAFDELIVKYSPRLYGLVYNMTSNHEDTNDLMQDIWAKAFRSINGFRGKSSFYTWIHSIGVNMTLTGSWLTMNTNANVEGGAFALSDTGLLTLRATGTALAGLSTVGLGAPVQQAQAQQTPVPATGGKKPNILVIFGDDVGQTNISAYGMGVVGYWTPNIDRIAKEGMMFTDYYAEQSCTAGRSTFITGQCTLRTGLSKVGVPGATVGLQKADATIADPCGKEAAGWRAEREVICQENPARGFTVRGGRSGRGSGSSLCGSS